MPFGFISSLLGGKKKQTTTVDSQNDIVLNSAPVNNISVVNTVSAEAVNSVLGGLGNIVGGATQALKESGDGVGRGVSGAGVNIGIGVMVGLTLLSISGKK